MLHLHPTLVSTHTHTHTHTKRHNNIERVRERDRERERETTREGDTERGFEGGHGERGWRDGEETENVRTVWCGAKRSNIWPLDAAIYGRIPNTSGLNLRVEGPATTRPQALNE
jgi:hypothetical protein